jgi:hypothetical protein
MGPDLFGDPTATHSQPVGCSCFAFLVANSCQSEKLQETQLIFQNLATVELAISQAMHLPQ